MLQINRKTIFYGILAFLLVVNFLILGDFNKFYIRAILGFIFIITIPGLLIMLMLKIREIEFLEYLVYTIGLSIFFIMFAGLFVNWTLPFLHITDKPLSLYPIIICFDIFLLIMWFVAIIKNYELQPIQIKFPKLDITNRIFFIIPMIFPVLSVLGAFILNNNGPNILTMMMLGSIAVYVFCVVLYKDKLNENVLPWSLWLIGLSLLLSYSMRSWYVNGVDTNLEYSIFNMTLDKEVWVINNFKNAYNAMLSVNILPSILLLFIKINSQYVQKLFFSIIFNFTPLLVYLISKKYFGKSTSFFAGLFFVFQLGFMNWSKMPSRQEISSLFFGLMLLVLFSKEIGKNTKKILFMIFGFSMIVSHYSTAYIALAIFLLTYIMILIYRLYEIRKIRKGKLHPSYKQEFYLTGFLVLLLLTFGFIWYSQVTNTSNGLIDFAKKSFGSIKDIFNKEVQVEGASPLEQFSIFPKKTDVLSLTKEYEQSTLFNLSDTYPNTNYNLYPKSPLGVNSVFNKPTSLFILYLREFLKVFGKILVIFGVVYLYRWKENFDINFIFINVACLLIFAFLLILPFISIEYDVVRTYQQILIFLSGSAMFGALGVFKKIPKMQSEIFISLFLILYFLALSGIFYQISGGTEVSLRLNNVGSEYSSYYVHYLELKSFNWLKDNSVTNGLICLDDRAVTRALLSLDPNLYSKLIRELHPFTIKKNYYVYSVYHNKIYDNYYKTFRGNSLSFNFPTRFLNENKNKIYANGGSEIFR